MPKSNLFGRRIHITGSISKDPAVSTPEVVDLARKFVQALVKELVKRGANFVVPVDAEPTREADKLPICFDWLVWETINNNILSRPADVPGVLAIGVQHHKTGKQIPEQYKDMWATLSRSAHVTLDNASFWDMSAKRMEAQAARGEILLPLGGTEGALYLTNLYHAAGKHVVPINLPITAKTTGAQKVYDFGLGRGNAKKLFQTTTSNMDPHAWLNRINFEDADDVALMVNDYIELLEALERPRAFAVRLLDPKHTDFDTVEDFFETVVKPVVQDDLGFKLVVVDGIQSVEHARIDTDIFEKLHRSQLVIADVTGGRPNCFIELGYALGRGLPTIVSAKENSDLPFDIKTFAGHHWKVTGGAVERRRLLKEHWQSIQNRAALVNTEPLIS